MHKSHLQTTPYYSGNYLHDREDMVAYLDAARELGDSALLSYAMSVIARVQRAKSACASRVRRQTD
jgi:DNA-binding phage protein